MSFAKAFLVLLLFLPVVSGYFIYELDLEVVLLEDLSCDADISLQIDKSVYLSGEQITFEHKLSRNVKSFEIEYWIEDLDGNIIKKSSTTTNLNPKTYTPKTKEAEKTLIFKNSLKTSCLNNGVRTSEARVLIINPDGIRTYDSMASPNSVPEKSTASENKNKTSGMNKVTGSAVYESSSEKAKNYTGIFVLTALVVFIIVLLFKKKL